MEVSIPFENLGVRKGESVKQGQVIAKSGSSGNSTGGHLHFEMRLNGTKIDPLEYVSVNNPRPGKVLKNNRGMEEVQ